VGEIIAVNPERSRPVFGAVTVQRIARCPRRRTWAILEVTEALVTAAVGQLADSLCARMASSVGIRRTLEGASTKSRCLAFARDHGVTILAVQW